MPLPKKASFEILDPRKGEERLFRIGRGRTVSSLRHGLLVVYYYPGRVSERAEFAPALTVKPLEEFSIAAMLKLGGTGFVTCSHVTKSFEERVAPNFNGFERAGLSGIGYFPLDEERIRDQLNTRKRLVEYQEWVVGTCDQRFQRSTKQRGWFRRGEDIDLSYLLAAVERVRCLSVFSGETGEVILACRLFEGIDDYLTMVARSVDISTA